MSLPFQMCGPEVFMQNGIPWMTIARHTAALCVYALALIQWPSYIVSEWAGEDRPFAYNLSSLMFTLCFWCACLFHYVISAGRVEVDWSRSRMRAKGWIVKTSRRAHRVLLSFALAISAMTVIQSTANALVITHFYVKEDEPHAKENLVLVLLKINQTLAFFFFIYVIGRLVFEPVSIRKVRRRNRTEDAAHPGDAAVPLKSLELPEEAQACNICWDRFANRQLGCGHVICCCCLAEIWRVERTTVARCAFCRADIALIKKIRLTVDSTPCDIRDCCGEMVAQLDEGTSNESQSLRSVSRHSQAREDPVPDVLVMNNLRPSTSTANQGQTSNVQV